MKKILFLGGSTQQIPVIKYAKRQGYKTILCDYLADNPGQYEADDFFQVSTTDKEAILKIAEDNHVDGVVSYASDPAAPTAAYVAENLGLPTNPYESVRTLAYKDLFRKYLKEQNFFSPRAESFSSIDRARENLSHFNFPIIVKPIDSSGSKGIKKVYERNQFDDAYTNALSHSRAKVVIIEEFIEKDHDYIIGGDIYVVDGKVEYWGLLNCHRNPHVNNLVPVGKSYPLLLNDDKLDKVKINVQRLLNQLNIRFGGFNLEAIIDKNDNVFLIELGPRNGGNYIPEFLESINGVNMIEATVEHALGNRYDLKPKVNSAYYSTFNIHSSKNGYLEKLTLDSSIEKKIYFKKLTKKKNDFVEYFDSSNKSLGTIFTKHQTLEELKSMMRPPYSWFTIMLTDDIN